MKPIYYLNIILLVSSLSAAENNKSVYQDEIASKINFELINKSAIALAFNMVALETKGDYYMVRSGTDEIIANSPMINDGFIVIEPGDTFAANIPLDKPTEIEIGRILKSKKNGTFPTEIEKYSINAPTKTRYISYDISKNPGKRLSPQIGPMNDLGKRAPNFIRENRTNSGLLKRNNVGIHDISVSK